MNSKDSRWRRYGALLVFIAGSAIVYVFRARIGSDFWPPDRSFVGPNLLATVIQDAGLLVILVLVYPPLGRAVHRFIDRKTEGIHAKLDALHERHNEHDQHLEKLGRSLADLHEKLDAQVDQSFPTRRIPDSHTSSP